ncbi:MAG: cytochrome c [Maritimibacter sp.]|nr:cytochrome c [Maritimibacter sp.]
MSKTRAFLLGLAATATLGTATLGTAVVAQDANPAVTARQSLMRLYAFNLGTLGAMAQGNVEYDADAAQAAADNLVKLSSLSVGPMWAAGTDDMSIEGTRALPTLWDNMADVGAKAGALAAAAEGMAAAAGTDLASLQGAMGPLGGACADCHKAYRAPE